MYLDFVDELFCIFKIIFYNIILNFTISAVFGGELHFRRYLAVNFIFGDFWRFLAETKNKGP
jgi:hypothetical protein